MFLGAESSSGFKDLYEIWCWWIRRAQCRRTGALSDVQRTGGNFFLSGNIHLISPRASHSIPIDIPMAVYIYIYDKLCLIVQWPSTSFTYFEVKLIYLILLYLERSCMSHQRRCLRKMSWNPWASLRFVAGTAMEMAQWCGHHGPWGRGNLWGSTISGALAVVDSDDSGTLDFQEFVQLLLIYRSLANLFPPFPRYTKLYKDPHGKIRIVCWSNASYDYQTNNDDSECDPRKNRGILWGWGCCGLTDWDMSTNSIWGFP